MSKEVNQIRIHGGFIANLVSRLVRLRRTLIAREDFGSADKVREILELLGVDVSAEDQKDVELAQLKRENIRG